tara:strand:+ start:25039 stop:25677 length:639 start_codon:yes stop_codon:yes gene_type:complete
MAIHRTISDFKSALQGGGARPNLFEVAIPNLPVAADTTWDTTSQTNFNFLCKAAALPASNIAPIEVPFRGRTLKVAGDRTFDTWTVTIINDEDFSIRTAMETWMNGISKLDNASGATNPTSYMSDAFVYQLGKGAGKGRFSTTNNNVEGTENGVRPLRTYQFFDIFPTNVAQIDLSYDTPDSIEEYTVEFQVQYWQAGADNDAQDQTQSIIR